MVARFSFFLLVFYLLWMTVSSAQVRLEEADSFVSVFGSFLKPRHYTVLEVPCKSIKRSVFVSVETGGEEGERIIVGRIGEGAAVCSSSADSPRTVFGIDQTPLETAADVGCVGGHDDGRKREGPGRGGTSPGGGDDGPGGDDPGSGGGSDGDEENLGFDEKRRDELNKLAKISIFITAQTAASLISFPKENASASVKDVLYLSVGMDMCAYIFCFTAVFLRKRKPLEASIMAVLGISCSSFGFLLAMCLIVPANFLWVVLVAPVVLLSCVSILLLSYN